MSLSWTVTIVVLAVIAAIITIAILAKREGHKTKRFRVGFFWERDHFNEKKGGEDDLRDE